MSCYNVCNSTVFVLLLCSCIAVFVLHSLYFILKFTDDTTREEFKKVTPQSLQMPALVICNRMPFSQDGINSINGNIRQEDSIRYLREWTNPGLREAADYFPTSPQKMANGYNLLIQYISPLNRNQSMMVMENKCEQTVASCSFNNVIQNRAADCCRNVRGYWPTTNGLCFLWHDMSIVQNTTGVNLKLDIIFSIPRNSWYAQYLPTHPGIDVYLRENTNDPISIASELGTPIRLYDRKGVRLRMHKEMRATTRRMECGQAIGDARRSDEDAMKNNKTNLLMCNILVSLNYCGCHPLISEMLPIDLNRYRDFSTRINSTNVCSVEQYDNCTRRYVDLARPYQWDEPIPFDIRGYDELVKCRDNNQRTCLMTSYPGSIDQYDLPQEYQISQDYISKLTVEYSTMKVTEVLESKDPNLYELLSYVGYNFALWFCIAHVIWSAFHFTAKSLCGKKKNKVAPRTLSVSAPVAHSAPDETPVIPSAPITPVHEAAVEVVNET